MSHVGVTDLTTAEFIGVADKFTLEDAETWWHFEVRKMPLSPSAARAK